VNRSYLYIAIAVIAFSTMELAGKVIASQLNPFQLTFLRFLIGGLILLPFAIKEINDKNIRLSIKDFFYFAWAGFLCIMVSMSFFQLAIVYTKASIVAVIFSTNPIFTIPLAHLFLKEKITKSTFFALAASLAGIIFIINPLDTTPDLKGIIFAILSSLTFSLCSIAIKIRVGKYGALPLNCLSFILGDLMLFILLLYSRIPITKGLNSGNIFTVVYLGVFVTGIGYLCYFLAMAETSAATASMVFFIKPALAPLLSFLILHESIPFNTLAGIAFILTGATVLFVSNLRKAALTDEGINRYSQ